MFYYHIVVFTACVLTTLHGLQLYPSVDYSRLLLLRPSMASNFTLLLATHVLCSCGPSRLCLYPLYGHCWIEILHLIWVFARLFTAWYTQSVLITAIYDFRFDFLILLAFSRTRLQPGVDTHYPIIIDP